MSALRILIPVLLVLAGGAYLVLRPRGETTEALDPRQAGPAQTTPAAQGDLAPAPTAESQPALHSDAPAEGDATEAANTPPPTAGDTRPTPEPLPDERDLRREAFLAARAHLTVTELRAERELLEGRIAEAKREAFALRFERHDYDIVYPEDPPAPPPPLGPGNRSVLTEYQTTVDPNTQQVAANVARLPFDQYPELYQWLDEADWLGELIGD